MHTYWTHTIEYYVCVGKRDTSLRRSANNKPSINTRACAPIYTRPATTHVVCCTSCAWMQSIRHARNTPNTRCTVGLPLRLSESNANRERDGRDLQTMRTFLRLCVYVYDRKKRKFALMISVHETYEETIWRDSHSLGRIFVRDWLLSEMPAAGLLRMGISIWSFGWVFVRCIYKLLCFFLISNRHPSHNAHHFDYAGISCCRCDFCRCT